MPTYYSPEGNPEVWQEKPAGYLSPREWRAAHPAPAPEPEPPTPGELFDRLRQEREARLRATDYLAMPDYPLPAEARAEVAAYRQALRDLPAQAGAPWDGGGEGTPWPEMPVVAKAPRGEAACA